MLNYKLSKCLAICVTIWGLTVITTAATAQKKAPPIPDFTQGDTIPEGAKHQWNLGPTGARGWIYSHRLETTQARQILVTSVEQGSPAANVLQPGDVILGIRDQPFQFDPRTELGKAITEAESKSGSLALMRWRDGKTKTVRMRIPKMGRYSATAPFDCQKSKRIFEQGCEELAARMKQNPQAGNGITRSLNTLALLASGKKEYLPIIKEQVAWASQFSDVEGRSLNCWFYGPINMLLAEYTLVTGDTTYLNDLRRITMEIVAGQSAVGSWGHRFSRPDGRLNGYGMMNAPGLPMTVSLILARKAGVDDPALDEAIDKSVGLIRFYVGKGCVPYGDHAPWMETHDDNGKNGIAAIMFNILEESAAAEYFSRMSTASHGAEREMGHTGNYFNMLWALPGVAISGPQATGAWMDEFGWYYDLARGWKGNFQHQGPAQPKPDSYRNWDASGAYLLAYAQPLRKLYITGKVDDVVQPVNQKTAQNLVAAGKGYSHRDKQSIYADLKPSQLKEALTSWSPVVRERAAQALARDPGTDVDALITMLQAEDTYTQLGACQALAALRNRSAKAVPQLQTTLKSPDLWVRIKAAEALAAIGDPARPAIPQLLNMLVNYDAQADPRGMQPRYLCFALFDRRNGLLNRSLDGIDREQLYEAVRSGLENEDGRARGALGSVYRNLSLEEIKPLLPAIHHAVVESAPSGMMFADGIRLSGLEILAKHKVKEGMELCINVIEPDRWGQGKRIPKCLNTLQVYGGAAKPLLPKLRELKSQLKKDEHIALLDQTIEEIQSDNQPPEVVPLQQLLF